MLWTPDIFRVSHKISSHSIGFSNFQWVWWQGGGASGTPWSHFCLSSARLLILFKGSAIHLRNLRCRVCTNLFSEFHEWICFIIRREQMPKVAIKTVCLLYWWKAVASTWYEFPRLREEMLSTVHDFLQRLIASTPSKSVVFARPRATLCWGYAKTTKSGQQGTWRCYCFIYGYLSRMFPTRFFTFLEKEGQIDSSWTAAGFCDLTRIPTAYRPVAFTPKVKVCFVMGIPANIEEV